MSRPHILARGGSAPDEPLAGIDAVAARLLALAGDADRLTIRHGNAARTEPGLAAGPCLVARNGADVIAFIFFPALASDDHTRLIAAMNRADGRLAA